MVCNAQNNKEKGQQSGIDQNRRKQRKRFQKSLRMNDINVVTKISLSKPNSMTEKLKIYSNATKFV